ncbi:MAG: hypothetical protein AB1757_24475 [Acidobacteriota bacterium]
MLLSTATDNSEFFTVTRNAANDARRGNYSSEPSLATLVDERAKESDFDVAETIFYDKKIITIEE